jgi:hypothetical protein
MEKKVFRSETERILSEFRETENLFWDRISKQILTSK